jgi:hypothetical protein
MLHKSKDNVIFDASMILKIVELVQAYCPPDRKLAYLECDSCERISHCLECWIEWFGDAAKMNGE